MKVLWSELFPLEFKNRLEENPVVYFPLGLCEPHGQISAFGLDMFKAEEICKQVAEKNGGVLAPSQSYHIHESGPSAKWLEEQIGEMNPHMTSVSPSAFFYFFLYQLRAFYNAGFKKIVILSGHAGAHKKDLKKVSGLFSDYFDIPIWYGTDAELVEEQGMTGDHAGKYEISMLMYIRPELVDLSTIKQEIYKDNGKRFALDTSALEASAAYGKQIVESCVSSLLFIVQDMKNMKVVPSVEMLSYQDIERLWNYILQRNVKWACLQPRGDQLKVSDKSRWKHAEYTELK
ncbi:creatininase family protein [Chengkuizengella axinellae]|uniref:Creatininase family protein n=1 Tax=Chengkuizengella axinellae TaxID=3064388 RepID=A0ABT9IZJ9_9BACL|nr:creatininase family protein [Chengkuizengella sp. 2205SS18-9]MDP5274794.1 creatininase family protein [Chengkuizengella sp. 2205SS18-9]